MGLVTDQVEVAEFFLAVAHTNGYAFYCGKCGQVWGRLKTVGNSYYSHYQQNCKKHWEKFDEECAYVQFPGTMLRPPQAWLGEFFSEKELPRLLKRLSDDHLKYEFECALEWAERKQEEWLKQQGQSPQAASPASTSSLKA